MENKEIELNDSQISYNNWLRDTLAKGICTICGRKKHSNCCNAPIKEDSDICSQCGEHCKEVEI